MLICHYIYKLLQFLCAGNVPNILQKWSQLISSPVKIAMWISPLWLWVGTHGITKREFVSSYGTFTEDGDWIIELGVKLEKRIIQLLDTLFLSLSHIISVFFILDALCYSLLYS